MTFLTEIGNFLKSEEAKIATELQPVVLAIKADLAPVGLTLENFLEQDGAALLTGAATALAGGATPEVAIAGTLVAVKAIAVKQGVQLAETSATVLAANLVAKAQDPAAATASVN